MFQSVESLIWGGAFVLTLWLAAAGAERQRLDPWSMYVAGALGLFGALWGGSVFAQAMAGNGIDFLRLFSGEKGVFGAIMGAAVLSLSFLAWRRLPVLAYVDAATPAVFVGYVMMRILCFMDGHCYGVVSDVPWAVHFAPNTEAFANHLAQGWVTTNAAQSLAVHPTQLYHALLGVVAFIILLRMKTVVPGKRFATALMLYGGGRFVIEFFRGDAAPIFGPLDVNHIAALLMLAVGLLLWRFRVFQQSMPAQSLTT